MLRWGPALWCKILLISRSRLLFLPKGISEFEHIPSQLNILNTVGAIMDSSKEVTGSSIDLWAMISVMFTKKSTLVQDFVLDFIPMEVGLAALRSNVSTIPRECEKSDSWNNSYICKKNFSKIMLFYTSSDIILRAAGSNKSTKLKALNTRSIL